MEYVTGIVSTCGEKVARNGQAFTWFRLAPQTGGAEVFLIAYAQAVRGRRSLQESAGRYLIRVGARVSVSFRPPTRPGLGGHVARISPGRDREPAEAPRPCAPL